MINGSCLCGAIRFTVSVPVTDLRACHCRNCQKASGAGGSVNCVVPSAAFSVSKGTPKRYTAVADSGRTRHRFFCADCGSPIYSQREATPAAHIWTKSARPWAYIDPAATRHPGQPDAPAK